MKRILAAIATAALAGFLVSACDVNMQADHASKITYHYMPGTEDLGLPFSSAVQVDNTLYLSGNLGNVPGTMGLAPGGIEAETRQTLENIRTVAEQFGSSMDRIVKCTVFLADMQDWAAMNEVYRTFFTHPPARSAFGTTGLALGARVEIECIAIVE